MGPYLVGSQEEELHELLEWLMDRRPSRVVDIGCAEGYYAVGLAVRLPEAEVIAYDIDPLARDLCEETARLNEVATRVHVRGECTTADLRALAGPNTLLVLDCEGAELELLEPESIPGLRNTVILVELHDFIDPTITPTICDRFEPTHEATLIVSRTRDPGRYTILDALSVEDRTIAVDEMRPAHPHPMQWALLVPRH